MNNRFASEIVNDKFCPHAYFHFTRTTDSCLNAVRSETKCDSSSPRASIPATSPMNTSLCAPAPVTQASCSQNNLGRVSDSGNTLRTTSREPCLTPQLNYIPPGLHCQLADSGDYLEVCASGRFAAGHVWGPYLIHLTNECRQRLRTADDHNSASSFNIAVKNDGTIADPNAIVLGEEHTWIKLLYESGLRSSPGPNANLDLLVDPTSKTITLVVTAEITIDNPLRGILRIRTGNSASPTQRNEPGYTGISNSFGSANVSANLKAAVHLSPGSHNASSPVPGAVTGHGVVQTSTITGHSFNLGSFISLSGSRTNGSKRPISRNGTVSLSTTGDLTMANGLSTYTNHLPLFAGIPFDKLNALSALTNPLAGDILSSHLDYADLSASLLQSVLPVSFGSSDTNVVGANIPVPVPGSGVTTSAHGDHDPTNVMRASIAATLMPYLTHLLPSAPIGTLCAPLTSTTTAPKSEITSNQSTKSTESSSSSIQTGNVTKSTSDPGSQTVDLDHAEKRTVSTAQPRLSVERAQPELCHTPTLLSERLISSPLYCNGCQRFFASGQLYSCHLQMSYRLLRSSHLEATTSASVRDYTDHEIDNETGKGDAFHLAIAASRLGLVLAAPLVTTNGIHYVPVHPACGTQYDANGHNPNSNVNSYTYSHYTHLGQTNTTAVHQQQQQQQQQQKQKQHPQQQQTVHATNNGSHNQKHPTPSVHSTKSSREFSTLVDHEKVPVKSEPVNSSVTTKQPIVVRNTTSKILDLSCTPQTMTDSTPCLGRDVSHPPMPYTTDTTTDVPTTTGLKIPNGLSSSPATGPSFVSSSVEFSPYSNLLQLFTQLMTTGIAEPNETDTSGVTNLSQLLTQLYSNSGLYGPLTNHNSSVPTVPTSVSGTATTSSPVIPLFAPFWLAQTHDAPLGGLSGSLRAKTHVNQTPPTSPNREPKSVTNPIDLLASIYSSQVASNSNVTVRAETASLGKSANATGTVNPMVTANPGQVILPNQASPTGSPESPSCRPYLCTYCQTRFQAYTTYMAHQDIYCQARREALKNIRVPSAANSTSSGNSTSTVPVPVTGSSSPTSFLTNKRRRIQSPCPMGELNKQQDTSAPTQFSLSSPNVSSASGGSGDDDPEASSPTGIKADPSTVRRTRLDDISGPGVAELSESSSCPSSGLQWEVCGSTELRCSACGYVGQTARGMKMHKRLHDCNGTVSR
ncbi:hypothetical protein FBUS_04834 [Fasciolopsis buskii]|uniref:Zinc finger protein n=1 Tax=Fasciolopsis buskii TaxID=27845 RepID=A0A8E0RZC1_9TREM|nr:hypothetical protein FBUS_04834 [Fasciolopsis buski]